MKKASLLLVLTIIALNLSGCLGRREFEYMHSTAEISMVEIVETSYNCKSDSFSTLSLAQISDVDEFVKRLSEVRYYAILTDPFYFTDESKTLAIKISYSNGDYEVVSTVSKARFESENGDIDFAAPSDQFDSYQFDSMLQFYLQNTQAKYTLMYNISEVDAIDYVRCGFENGENFYEVIVPINDAHLFIADMDSLRYFYNAPGTDSREGMIVSGDAAFRITYKNGDFELFNDKGRVEFCSLHGRKTVHIGHFDSEQFEDFVQKYTQPQ